MNRVFYILFLSIFFIQCEEASTDKAVPIRNVQGKYMHIEEENIYLFVPENTERFTTYEYAALIDSIPNEELRRRQRNKLLNLKYGTGGGLHLFASKDFSTEITFKKVPHITINQETAQIVLKLLNREHESLGNLIGLESRFKKAGIIRKENDRFFRAIFSFEEFDPSSGVLLTFHTYYYWVNRQGKSFILTFNTDRGYDFDSYVQKIRL
ncbi:hypothetical protein [Kordia zhangzhouensis]|uniref:hypothetical protein n=1 Tax=Kordia zhangzhouensis TaxID=1620405 RepID=UPI0006299922|nr:hypothetical protein [Kordia zhangzhouensis]